MDFPWGHSRRFNSYPQYFERTFGYRVQKLSLNVGFTCPNRDGSKGKGGCTYCNNNAFNPSYCLPEKSITQQLKEGAEFHSNRYRRAGKYLAYFQAYTNTYDSLDALKLMYEEALSFDGVVGLVIGTRPDCVSEELLDYLKGLNQRAYIKVEYGIESCYDKTLEMINRGHDFETTKWAIHQTAKRGIPVGAHLIFGLPGESREEMLNQTAILSELPLTTIKFHQLQIVKATVMAKQYREDSSQFSLFDLEDYIQFVIEFTENLNPNFVIERFASEVPPRFLESAAWENLRYDQILVKIEKELERKDSWQGRIWLDHDAS